MLHSQFATNEKFIKPTLNSNKLLLNTLNNFLDISEIDIGKFEYEVEKVNISELINEVKTILEIQFIFKNIKLLIIKKLREKYIWTDYKRLKQILINILQNSLKFSPIGSNDIIIEIS
jgi:signal transduction histidine kinase